MPSRLIIVVAGTCLVTVSLALPTGAAEPLGRIELEIAAERSVGPSLQRQWYERLKRLGLGRLRIRQARPNETPVITAKPGQTTRYKVVAVLTSGDRLLLPGRSVSSRHASKLRAYLTKLTEEGVEGVTAARGTFGLTKKQFDAIHNDLSQPITFDSRGQSLRAVVTRLSAGFSAPIAPDLAAERSLDRAKAADELAGYTAGTGLAILLRAEGLALRPVVNRGKLKHRIVVAEPGDTGDLRESAAWTIGHKSKARTRQLAPKLLETVPVEIVGYTLEEAIDALRDRIGVPILFDHFALAKQGIDIAKVEVSYPARKTLYKSLLNNLLFQARLKGDLRVDEAGKAFFWVTTSRRSRSR